jgi:VIT1/CCC1 family predicted Fe2+/Mn2+ transporter
MTDISARPINFDTHHRDVTGGWLRAGVFGAMDGLISNFALISGVVGGGASPRVVVLTGVAGLTAGALSMAVGEFISVASQSEAPMAEIKKEWEELLKNPDHEAAELAAIYRGYGVEAELAQAVATQIGRSPDVALRVHVREEMGVDADDLPSPWTAAIASFLCFSLGALIPLLPFLAGQTTIVAAAVLSAVGLFASGAVVSRLTVRSPLHGGLRQLLLGILAAAATFGIGSLVGTSL